jgi:DNA-binding response OmpR family regulator
LDASQRLALLRGRPLALTPTEFNLLACLVERAGQVVQHRELQSHVWHDEAPLDLDVESERLRTTLRTLRRALGPDADCIHNVRGVGYTFFPAS